MMKRLQQLVLLLILVGFTALPAQGQFKEPEFEKMSKDQWAWFMNKFDNIKWTGQGLYRKTDIDHMSTDTLRALLQATFGDPTKTIEDLVNTKSFRPGKAIQFEYWFTVDDSIPMMVLDIDGPFGRGLVYAGASRYIDLMPQVKRTFTQKLLEQEPAEYSDYFYSPEEQQWFRVSYKNGVYKKDEIDSPPGMTIDFDYN